AIDYNLPGTTEDAVLGQVIGAQIDVAIHVVFADVEYGGDLGIQRLGGLQLEAGQLQHIEIRLAVQQIQSRGADVAADGHTPTGLLGHQPDQGGHSALGIGTSDGDYGRLRGTGEELNITHYLHPGLNGRLDSGCGQRDTRIHDQLVSRTQQLRIQPAQAEVCHG